MSAAGSESQPRPPLTEAADDAAATAMTYDQGGTPWWLVVIWLSFAIGLATYLMKYYVPDLKLWLSQ